VIDQRLIGFVVPLHYPVGNDAKENPIPGNDAFAVNVLIVRRRRWCVDLFNMSSRLTGTWCNGSSEVLSPPDVVGLILILVWVSLFDAHIMVWQ